MRTTSLLLALLGVAPAALAAQAHKPDTTHVDTTFVRSKDISPPKLVTCPALPHTQKHGRVDVEMIIDTIGRPEPSSIKVTASPDDSLSAIAVRIAPDCRFKPGKYHHYRIRVLVTFPFTF